MAGAASLDLHPDRPADEVRVLLDQRPDLPFRGVVVQLVLGILGLEVQGDRGALRGVVHRGDGVRALAAGFPTGRRAFARLASQQRDLVGHHERRVEADPELADQLLGGGGVLGLTQLLAQFGRPGFGQRADQAHDLVPGHPDPVVADRQRPRGLVDVDLDVQIGGVDVEVLVPEGFEAKLVQGVGGVRDQLPQE